MGILKKIRKRDNYEVREIPLAADQLISASNEYWENKNYKRTNCEIFESSIQGFIKQAKLQYRNEKSHGIREFFSKNVPLIDIEIKSIEKKRIQVKHIFDFSEKFRKKWTLVASLIFVSVFFVLLIKNIESLGDSWGLDRIIFFSILIGNLIVLVIAFIPIFFSSKWKTHERVDQFWEIIRNTQKFTPRDMERHESKLYLPSKAFFP